MTTKTCSKCGTVKPATFEFFYRRKGATDGLRADCRSCCDVRNRQWAADNQDKWLEIQRRSTAKKMADPERRDAKRKAWVERYHNDADFRERCNARRMEHHRRDPEHQCEVHRQWYDRHREELNELSRQRGAEDPDKYRIHGRRRRARKLGASGSHTAEDVAAQYKRQHGKCYWCEARVGKDYHVDHVIPLSKGGSDGPDNIVIACPSCNLHKNAKLPHECTGRLC